MDDSGGVRLIAAHLAQIKLQAAEERYAAKRAVGELEQSLAAAMEQLESSRQDVETLQAQIKQMQTDSTYKTLVAEREKWKGLIDTLRKDKKELMAETAALRDRLGERERSSSTASGASLGSGSNRPRAASASVAQREGSHAPHGLTVSTSPSSLAGTPGGSGATPASCGGSAGGGSGGSRSSSVSCEEPGCVALRSEVHLLRKALEAREVETQALRAKLDRELELKWERGHKAVGGGGGSGWQKSLLESFAEVLAPYPSAADELALQPAEDEEEDEEYRAMPESPTGSMFSPSPSRTPTKAAIKQMRGSTLTSSAEEDKAAAEEEEEEQPQSALKPEKVIISSSSF
jgi:hypothetical protein